MEHILYWLWLTGLFGVNSGRFLPMIEKMGGIENFYNAKVYPKSVEFSSKTVEKLNNKSLEWAETVCGICTKKNIRILTVESTDYPEVLTHIFIPPVVLYAKGKVPDWDELFMIGVVGTRKATKYGINVTKSICDELAQKGVTIVSGLARGIDTQATKSAVNTGAFSIGLCGCGVDVNYPSGNKKLKAELIKNGLLLSEYPPGTLAGKWTFRPRNRIIAGLSRGVLVTEAPKHSGALITAYGALDENRDVFAVPGKIDDENFAGINALIKSGAKPVFSADDILVEYPGDLKKLTPVKKTDGEVIFDDVSLKPPKTTKKKKEPPIMLKPDNEVKRSPAEIKILELLATEDIHIDELMRRVDAPANSIHTAIFLLEMCKNIERLPGNIFHRLK